MKEGNGIHTNFGKLFPFYSQKFQVLEKKVRREIEIFEF